MSGERLASPIQPITPPLCVDNSFFFVDRYTMPVNRSYLFGKLKLVPCTIPVEFEDFANLMSKIHTVECSQILKDKDY